MLPGVRKRALILVKGLEDPIAEVRVVTFQWLGKLTRKTLKQIATGDLKLKLVKGLEDPDADVRAAAFQCLGRLSQALQGDLSADGLKSELVKGLEDPDADVRAAAFQCLGGLSQALQADLSADGLKSELVKGLEDPDADVRAAAFQCLGGLSQALQADLSADGLKSELVKGLEDPDADVRAAAFQCLGGLSQALQADLSADGLKSELVKGIEDPDADVRRAPFQCLSNFASHDFRACDWKLELAKGREDPVEKVRRAACEALEEFWPVWGLGLDQYILEQVKGLESRYWDVRHAASRVLVDLSFTVSTNCLARDAAEIVYNLETQWGSGSTYVQQGSLHAAIRSLFKVPIEDESKERNTWLHIAARCGCTTVCQALLANGLAMKSLRNAKHQTASDVARLNDNAGLASLLSPGTFQTRGGSGGAIAKALDSEDKVEEVSWWFIPLPGWEGKLGAVHSILKIDAGRDQYLIEGACPEIAHREGAQRPEIERASENGLFISSWAEINDAANVEKLTDVKLLHPSRIELAALVKHLLQQGPYDVGSNNCHHTAFHGYNFCAAEQLQCLPINDCLTNVAWILSKVGINLALSTSSGGSLPFFPIYAGIPRDENVTLALPRHWTGEVRNGAVDLGKGSDEFLKVEAYLKENGGDQIPGFQIIDIKRNQNLKMLRTFRNELYDMHEQRQLRVFHSASDGDAHDKVMKEGFKMAYSNMTFNAYGAGLYFAQDLRLPDYFSPKSDAGVKQVLLCCVAAGRSHLKKRIFPFVPGDRLSGRSENEWQSELRKPKHRQAPGGYDSCIAQSREALIVYREGQVLWEYAIQYQSTGSAGNPYGDLRGFLKEVPQT
eukprot:Skav222298  [mRNA]  locus=scaffold3734:186826:189354:+ [translate_table: standard]